MPGTALLLVLALKPQWLPAGGGGLVVPTAAKVYDEVMEPEADILVRIQESASKRVLFLPHAIRQMSRPDRAIKTSEVRAVLAGGEVIEDYPDDPRGHSCLLLGSVGGRPIHVVCAPKDDYLAIITAYLPDPYQWTDDYRRRNTQ